MKNQRPILILVLVSIVVAIFGTFAFIWSIRDPMKAEDLQVKVAFADDLVKTTIPTEIKKSDLLIKVNGQFSHMLFSTKTPEWSIGATKKAGDPHYLILERMDPASGAINGFDIPMAFFKDRNGVTFDPKANTVGRVEVFSEDKLVGLWTKATFN